VEAYKEVEVQMEKVLLDEALGKIDHIRRDIIVKKNLVEKKL